jgi:hypothetical protein
VKPEGSRSDEPLAVLPTGNASSGGDADDPRYPWTDLCFEAFQSLLLLRKSRRISTSFTSTYSSTWCDEPVAGPHVTIGMPNILNMFRRSSLTPP